MKNIYLPLFLFFLLLSACGPVIRYYEPVMFNESLAYIPKPISHDSIRTSQYITLGYGGKSVNNFSENVSFGALKIARSHYIKNFNVAYSANGYLGTYHANLGREDYNQPRELKNINFSGIQINTSANFVQSEGRIDTRFIGLELSYNQEFGDYHNFRSTINTTQNNYSITQSSFFSGGLSSEIIWHSKKSVHNQYGVKIIVGKVMGKYDYKGLESSENLERSVNKMIVSTSLFYQFQKFHFILEYSLAPQINVGYRF